LTRTKKRTIQARSKMTRNSHHEKRPYQKSCRICKTKFSPYRTTDAFCSYECRKQFEMVKPKPIQRVQQHEKRQLSKDEKAYLAQREKLRIKLIEAEKYFCYRCGVSQKNLECHHIIWRSEIPRHEEKHNHRNLIFVCSECHAWYHDKKGNRNSLVEKRKLYNVFGEKVRNK
jgi:hypothetical protein